MSLPQPLSNKHTFVLAAMAENTPELQKYWEKRYQELLERGLFQLSPKTQELLSDTPLDKPATPFGDLILSKHLDQNDNLDEVALQSTVETAVRFLDSLVDILPFTKEPRDIVNQYRKIGLGLADFKEYLKLRHSASELDEIDYLGNIISSSVYRASENLAEEKGTCKNWPLIKKHLRPKAFEFWYNVDTGEVKNGLELSEDMDQATIDQSPVEIIPRRNSNLLLFPPDLEWQIWSDRDNTSAKTIITQVLDEVSPDIQPVQKPVENTTSQSLAQEVVTSSLAVESLSQETSSTPLEMENSPEMAQSDNQDESQLDNPDLVISSDNLEDVVEQTPAVASSQTQSNFEPQNIAEPQEQETFSFLSDIEPVQETTPSGDLTSASSQDMSDEDKQLDLEPEKQLLEIPLTQDADTESEQEPNLSIPAISGSEDTVPEEIYNFQIGELVQIQDKDSLEYGKVYQVVDQYKQNNLEYYYLAGGHLEIEQKSWLESQLSPVELLEILDKINIPQNPIKDETIASIPAGLYAQAIVSHGDNILVHKNPDGYHLPQTVLNHSSLPKTQLELAMLENYGLSSRFISQFGSVFDKHEDGVSNLHLGFWFESETGQSISGLEWVNIHQLDLKSFTLNSLLEQWIGATDNLSKQFYASKPVSGSLDQPKNLNYNAVVSNLQNNNIPQSKHYSAMSKYSLKLEQLVKTNAFGDVLVSIQYDASGPKLIALNSDAVNPELRHLLDTVLGLVNFALTKQIAPSELATQLEREPQDGVHLPINDLLTVIAASLKEAPASVSQINPQILMEIVPEMLTQFVEQGTVQSPEQEAQEEPINQESQPQEQDSQDSQPQGKGFFGHFGN